MKVFDGVFHRQDMPARVGIAVVQQRGQCGGLARTRRPYREYQPPFEKRQLLEHGRKAERRQAGDLGNNMADHHAYLPTLPVHIHTKPLALRGLQGQVALHGGIELLPLRFVEDGIRHLLDIVGGQLLLPHGHKHALPLERGWRTRHDE